ncbi:hypothetical protein AOQ84DRAFT_351361 [Glonium stellatum]|uniref:Uncharacterized protein n=1 Tax=Glonium stellatum TaxID=574774 RepID=A0A8E2FCN6_9PEZI|nr:hypothetical protein AOQ84DRAFT_351361 [Glonium stellatum]
MIWDLTQPDDFPNIVIRGSKLYDVQTIGFQPNSHVLMTADRLRRVRYWDADQLHNAED